MLYASDLGKSTDPALLAAENLPEEIPDLVAEILARAVEQRQRRQLSTAFRQREDVLRRVRGRIDHLSTSRRQEQVLLICEPSLPEMAAAVRRLAEA